MKSYIKLLSVFAVLFVNTAVAQTTAIPDPGFEQALIDLNIDSDGVVNGQVLTADIENIVELNFQNVPTSDNIITNFTGIQDFTALEILDLRNSILILLDETQADIFSSNVNLRELIMKNQCGDCISIEVQTLDLSGLPNLELIDLTNVIIETLKFNNPSFDLSNLTLNLEHEGLLGSDFTQNICIEVDDPEAATNNQSPYDTWNIMVNDFNTSYGFSDNCTLSSTDFENLEAISVYPNPVKDKLWLNNPNQIKIDKAEIYTMSGQKVGSYSSVNDFINVEKLQVGVYFVKLYSKHLSSTVKLLKN